MHLTGDGRDGFRLWMEEAASESDGSWLTTTVGVKVKNKGIMLLWCLVVMGENLVKNIWSILFDFAHNFPSSRPEPPCSPRFTTGRVAQGVTFNGKNGSSTIMRHYIASYCS